MGMLDANQVGRPPLSDIEVVFDFIYNLTKNGLNLSEDDYNRYYSGITELTDQKREKIQHEISSKEGFLKKLNRDKKEIALGLLKPNVKSEVKKVGENRLDDLEDDIDKAEEEIKNLRLQLTDPEQDKLTIEQFLNLSKNASTIIQSANSVAKDTICRIIFLNFTVDEEKVLSYQLKQPFETMLKTRDKLSSRSERN